MPFAPRSIPSACSPPTAADMAELWSRGFGGRFDAELHRAACLRVPVRRPPMQRAVSAAVDRLRAAGVAIDEIDPPAGWRQLQAAARTINQYEGARSHRARYEEFGDAHRCKTRALVREGLKLPPRRIRGCPRPRGAACACESPRCSGTIPCILTPAAPGPAPAGLEGTGDPSPNAPWTALGVPAIAVPLPGEGGPLACK